jgi:enterobactin synthetase component D
MFRLLPSPTLFPPFVHHVSAAFDADLANNSTPLEKTAFLPTIAVAVSKRRSEFLAGRRCARLALAQCAPEHADEPLTVATDRSPRWPSSLVGSITHAGCFAAVAVTRSSLARGIGLDAEPFIEPSIARDIASSVASQPEILMTQEILALEDPMALTLIFSAKESLFKCLCPLVGRYFDFMDASIIGVDSAARQCDLRLLNEIHAQFPAGTIFHASFAIEAQFVHTGVLLSAEQE